MGGAEGRSKRLICLRRTWMEDTGGKSGRRPGRHLQVEASSPGGMFSSREYEETYIVANALVHPFPVTPPAHARAARRGHHHHAVVLLHQHEKRKGKEGNVATATRVLVRLVSLSWPSPTPQVQPLRAILRNDMPSSQQYPAGVPGAPPGGATTPSSAAKSTDLTAATRSMRRQRRGKVRRTSAGACCTGDTAAGHRPGACR